MRLSFRKPLMALAVIVAAGTFAAAAAQAEPGKYGKEHGKEHYAGCESKHKLHKHERHGGEHWIKGLTAEQKTGMSRLRVELKKELASIDAAVDLRKADIKNQVTSDTPDRKAVSRLAAEIAGLKTKALEAKYDHMIKVRSLLTPEQKLEFDSSVLTKDGRGKH